MDRRCHTGKSYPQANIVVQDYVLCKQEIHVFVMVSNLRVKQIALGPVRAAYPKYITCQ